MVALNEVDYQGWLLVALSSLACIVGASVVYIDVWFPSSHGSRLERPSVISGSMSLGAGVLIFSALFTLLPASQKRLQSDWMVYICFFSGVLITVALTRIIHTLAPAAIHTCGPHETAQVHTVDHHSQNHNHHNHVHTHHHHSHHHGDDEEQAKLLIPSSYGTIASTSHPDDPYQQEDYFRIGVQTAIAICIHKFPEGLIMFISSQASRQMGLSVCVALSIHNVIEGFMIALPLYFATRSRALAFGYAALLGGMAQPLGAAVGLVALNVLDENRLFGIVFGVVSGMMCLIAIQSMLPQAIKADTRHVAFFFFFGIFMIGLASLLKSV